MERTLVTGFRFLSTEKIGRPDYEFTPAIGRRAFVLGTIGLAAAGGGVGLARKLYRAATFSYDGTQYKGPIVQPITPNDLFYCVTKNVVDPAVNVDLWHLEIGWADADAGARRGPYLGCCLPTTHGMTTVG